LIDVCGGEEVDDDDDLPDNTNRNKQSFRYKNSNSNSSLTVDDIQLIVERFEVRERIDYISFLQYFSERLHLSHSRGSLSVSSTPYRVSSEWAALRVDARLLANSTVFRSQAEPSLESPTGISVAKGRRLFGHSLDVVYVVSDMELFRFWVCFIPECCCSYFKLKNINYRSVCEQINRHVNIIYKSLCSHKFLKRKKNYQMGLFVEIDNN